MKAKPEAVKRKLPAILAGENDTELEKKAKESVATDSEISKPDLKKDAKPDGSTKAKKRNVKKSSSTKVKTHNLKLQFIKKCSLYKYIYWILTDFCLMHKAFLDINHILFFKLRHVV